jgi:integrase
VSLFKRGDVYWSYFYRDGVRHQFSTGTPNRRQAETIEAKLKEDVNKSRFQIVESDPNITVGKLAACFIASGSVRPHHIYHLKFLLPYFGDAPVLRLTKSMADEFRCQRRATNPSIKDATVNRDLSVLRHVLYWGVDEQLIATNPLARMKMARERRTRRQVLSVAEEQILLPAAQDHLYAMIIAALDTGMRRGEITSQRWEDIDFTRKLLFVTRSKTPEGESREIPLTDRLLKYLLQHRQSEGLIVSYKEEPVRIVKRSWKTALKNAQIRHVRFHDLRHTFNTRLMEAGVLQEIRMALMGHSPGSTVHATYTHIELPVKRKAIEKLELWVEDQQKKKENKEQHDASTEAVRTENGPSPSDSSANDRGQAGTQGVEKEVARGGGSGASRKAQGRDRRNGRRAEGQAEAVAEVRRSQEDLRGELAAVERRSGGKP